MKKTVSKHPGGRPPLPEGHTASSLITLRVHPDRKAAYNAEARKKSGRSLAAWMFEKCDAASGYQPDL